MTFHAVCRFAAVLCLCLLIVAPIGRAAESENPLAIIDGGVQRSEDAPFVPKDFQFLPGEYVYFTFHITGFAKKVEPGERDKVACARIRSNAAGYEPCAADFARERTDHERPEFRRQELDPQAPRFVPDAVVCRVRCIFRARCGARPDRQDRGRSRLSLPDGRRAYRAGHADTSQQL